MSLSIAPFHMFFSSPSPLFFSTGKLSSHTVPRKTTVIRMGGGPRTYPGGVSKWQWKRMQAKKAKQLLKARLCRERQIYEMRKRAELKAAVSELERPWEAVEKAPKLFSVEADEQLKVLADRFQRPGGFDLWSDQDGPQLFQAHDGILSSRFFPKGVVHSIKPYGKAQLGSLGSEDYHDESKLNGSKYEGSKIRSETNDNREIRTKKRIGNKYMGRRGQRRGVHSTLEAGGVGLDGKQRGEGEEKELVHRLGASDNLRASRGRGLQNLRDSDRGGCNDGMVSRRLHNSRDPGRGGSRNDGRVRRSRRLHNSSNPGAEVYEMSVQKDGSYEFLTENEH